MAGAGNRWWGPRSDFPWEEDALRHIRDQMPDAEPYRAWQTFTFTARSGHVREVDLLIATPGGLFLVEIKSHPGRATNNGSTWLFRGTDTAPHDREPAALHRPEGEGAAGPARTGSAASSTCGIRIPRIEAGRLPLRAEPAL